MTSEGALNQNSGKSQDHLEKLLSSKGGSPSPIVSDVWQRKITHITALPYCIHPVLYKTPIRNIHPNLVGKTNNLSKNKIPLTPSPDSTDKLVEKYKPLLKDKIIEQKVPRTSLPSPQIQNSLCLYTNRV